MGKARKELAEIRHAFENIEGYEYAEDDTVFTFVTRIYGDVCRERDQARQTVAMSDLADSLWRRRCLETRIQRDALLAACEEALAYIEMGAINRAQDVIAKARGESDE